MRWTASAKHYTLCLYKLTVNKLNRGHPTFFVAPFGKYLVAFSLMETNFSPQVSHLRLVRNERTLILVAGRKTLGGPGSVRYTVRRFIENKQD